jgi:tetratricopeptide (TPR) repeat protein
MKHLALFILLPVFLMGQGTPSNEKLAADQISQAKALLSKNDTTAALPLLEKALVLDPKAIEANRLKAGIFSMRRQYQEALWEYNALIKNAPDDLSAYVNRAYTKEILEDYPGADADYTRALEIDPNNLMALDRLANIKVNNTNDYTGAIALIERLIKLSPGNMAYLMRKAQACQFSDKPADAIRVYNDIEKISPDDADMHFYRGMAYSKTGDKTNACKDLNKAVELGNPMAHEVVVKICQ